MKKASIVLLSLLTSSALAAPPQLPLTWIALGQWHMQAKQVQLFGTGDQLTRNCVTDAICNAIYNLHYPQGLAGCGRVPCDYGVQTQNQRITVDLKPFGVPATAAAAMLLGMAVITSPNTGSDMKITFAAKGDPLDCNQLIGQGTITGDGIRQPLMVPVPLKDGSFDYCFSWTLNSTTSYGWNFSLMMYADPAPVVPPPAP